MKKQVLIYNFDKEELSRAKRALLPLHFSVREVTREESLIPVGFIAGAVEDGTPDTGEYEFSGKLVVMAGFLGADLDRLLAAMRKAGFGRDVLKAMLTPSNCTWSGARLYSEIYREHMQMKGKG